MPYYEKNLTLKVKINLSMSYLLSTVATDKSKLCEILLFHITRKKKPDSVYGCAIFLP